MVESYNENSKYRIGDVYEDVIQIKSNSVYWEKENLLNIGINSIGNQDYSSVAFLDNDIKFKTNNWRYLMNTPLHTQ